MKLKRKYFYIFCLIIAILVLISPWFKTGIMFTDDFRHHGTRFVYLHNSLTQDFTFYEWMPYIYSGWPLLHFYHPMSYLLSLPLIFLLPPIFALKMSVALALAIAALSMFYCALKLYKKYDVALVAAIIYVFSPFVFETIYVAGSTVRIWAYAFIPLVFLYFVKSLETRRIKDILIFTALYTLSFLSHVIFTYSASLLLLTYLIYFVIKNKKISFAQIKVLLLITLLFSGFVVMWAIPTSIERGEAADAGLTTSVFGSAPHASPPHAFFLRIFGKVRYEGGWTNFVYVGYSVLIFSVLALFLLKNFKFKKFLASTFVIFWIFIFGNYFPINPLNLVPMAGFLFVTENLLVPLNIIMALLTGLFISAISKKYKNLKWIIFIILLAIVLIDIGPAFTIYNPTNLPTEDFTNPPALTDAWAKLKPLNNDFRVHSMLGQIPFYYHNKFEIGTQWMGHRQSALNPLRKITDDLEKAFQKNPINQTMLSAYGYMSTKYFVMQCAQNLDKFLNVFYSNQAICIYKNPKYSNLVVGIKNIREINDSNFWKYQELNKTTAYMYTSSLDTNSKIKEQSNLSLTKISDINFLPDSILFNTQNKGFALVKSAYLKNHWNAYIDGEKNEFLKVWPNYMLIEVPKGSHSIIFKYETNNIHRIVKFITFLTLILFGFLWWKKRNVIINNHSNVQRGEDNSSHVKES